MSTNCLRSLELCSNTQQQPFYGPLSGTTQVSRYQKKHSPTHHPDELQYVLILPQNTEKLYYKCESV